MHCRRDAARAAWTLALALALALLASPPAGADELEQARELMRSGRFSDAAQRLEPLAESGDMWAQFQLARLHAAGLGVPGDASRAAELFRQAAEAGHREARFAFGWALHTGDGVARDDAQAAHWWRLAARDGHPRAQYHLAQLLLHGQGVRADRKEAERLLHDAEAQGDTGAGRLLASLDNGATPVPGASVETASPAPKPAPPAPRAAAAAVPARGTIEEVSRWVLEQPPGSYTIQAAATSDPAEARAFAADYGLDGQAAVVRAMGGGEPLYKVLVGLFDSREAGREAMESLPGAVRGQGPWLRQLGEVQAEIESAMPEAGKERAAHEEMAMLAPATGSPSAKGNGPADEAQSDPQDTQDGSRVAPPASPEARLQSAQSAFNAQRYEEAYHLWLPLARDGLAPAQYGVAFLLESGWGNLQDFEHAVQWYRAAAEQGHAKAQFNLGLMYLSGQGTPRDDSLAVYWIQSAADNGDPRAQEYLNRASESSQ